MVSDQINVRNLEPDLIEKAQRIAKLQDRSLSQIIRELLRDWVAKNEHLLSKSKPKGK
jgi:hypothetical protein